MKNKIKDFLLKKRIKILRNKKGFSLLEVLVAVSIIGVISAIAVPQFQDYRRQASKTAGDTSVGNIGRAYQNCIVLKDFSECDSLGELGISCPDCVSNTDGSDNFCAGINKTVGGDTFKACIDFVGSNITGRAYGGSLMDKMKICKVARAGDDCGSGNVPAATTSAIIRTGPIECTDSNKLKKCGPVSHNIAGQGKTCTETNTCVLIDATGTKGECLSTGICDR